METENLNDKLRKLYVEKLGAGSPCFLQILREQRRSTDKAIQPAYPLLIKINDEAKYKKADLRIMIFGQETNSWETKVSQVEIPLHESCNFIDETVKSFMDAYLNFRTKTDLKSPFWNAFKKMHELTPKMNFEFIWNNIYKIGNRETNKNRPHKQIRELENEYFDVIHDEISILQPDALLFLTGPNYDSRVDKKFAIAGYQSISNIEERKLAKISISNRIPAYRTYHPGHLNRKGLLSDYLKLIIGDIAKV